MFDKHRLEPYSENAHVERLNNNKPRADIEFAQIKLNEEENVEMLPVYIATNPIDFRCAIDGLCMYIAERWNKNPQAGIYVFYNYKRDKLKLIYWDYNGFILLCKRLEQGRFEISFDKTEQTVRLTHQQLNWLLMGNNHQRMPKTAPIRFNQYA